MASEDKKLIPFNPKGNPASVRISKEQTATFDTEELKEKNVFGNKLVEARKNKKISQKELAEELEQYHISISAGGISKWEKGSSLPNAYQLFALCHILGITDPVAYFTGSLPEAPDFSPELNQKGINILQTLKDILIASGQYAPKSRRRTTALAEQIEMVDMRISTNRASAGTGNFLNDDQFEIMPFPVSQIPEGADFGIRIVGDSMEPYYYEGQIVWVEQCKELNPGEVGIFIYDGEGYIKKYNEVMPSEDEAAEYTCDGVIYPKVFLVSYNKAYPPKLVRPSYGFEIVGRVLN